MQNIVEFKEFLENIGFELNKEGYTSIYSRSNVTIKFEHTGMIIIQVYDKTNGHLVYEDWIYDNPLKHNTEIILIGYCVNNKIFDLEDLRLLLSEY